MGVPFQAFHMQEYRQRNRHHLANMEICFKILIIIGALAGSMSEVPDGFVYTDLQANFERGTVGRLKCDFYREPFAVYWRKGPKSATAQNLIVMHGQTKSGPCHDDGSCDIDGSDFSLIINNASTSDEGRYFCFVSNYKGILIHNYTDVSIYVLPLEPYPGIEDCKNQTNIETTRDLCLLPYPYNITCYVNGYYPDVDVFFYMNKVRLNPIDSGEGGNTDGTKDKWITVTTLVDNAKYTCVASGLPGTEARSTSVYVRPASNYTAELYPQASGNSAAIISVVLVTVILMCGAGIYFLWRKNKHRLKKRKPSGNTRLQRYFAAHGQREPISYIELWKLTDSKAENFQQKFRQIIFKLNGTANEEGNEPSDMDLFEALVVWKTGTDTECLHENLYSFMQKDKLEDEVKDMETYRQKNIFLSDANIEHIASSIRHDPALVTALLTSPYLGIDLNSPILYEVVDIKDSLKTWRKETEQHNMDIIMCLALEDAGLQELAKTFYMLPDGDKMPLEKDNIETFAAQLSIKHCKILATVAGAQPAGTQQINMENLTTLFRTDTLIQDWIKRQKCSNYEIRRKLETTSSVAREPDLEEDSGTLEEVCGTVENKDMFDLAYNIFMDDVYPFAKALGFTDEELRTYKLNFEVSSTLKGTCFYIKQIMNKHNYSKTNFIQRLDSLQNCSYGRIARKVFCGSNTRSQESTDVLLEGFSKEDERNAIEMTPLMPDLNEMS